MIVQGYEEFAVSSVCQQEAVEGFINGGSFPHVANLYKPNGTTAIVANGNCIEWMQYYVSQKVQVPFIFADPPFNIGQAYDVHDDRMPQQEFTAFNAAWINLAKQLLQPNGVMCINIPFEMLLQTLSCCHSCGTLKSLGKIIWHYRFGNCVRSKFISSHTDILVFRKGDGPHTWNPDAILVDSLRKTKYNDARIDDYENGGSRVPFDVWDDIPRVTGNSRERQGMENHPNQLPEKLLERLLKAYSNVGDWCLDPFGGTGTSSKVAASLDRHSITFEKSTEYYHDIVFRLLGVE